jgi:hypothetical protein
MVNIMLSFKEFCTVEGFDLPTNDLYIQMVLHQSGSYPRLLSKEILRFIGNVFTLRGGGQ